METVKTSEVLESQILEDARAKATRISGGGGQGMRGRARRVGATRRGGSAPAGCGPGRHGSPAMRSDLEASASAGFHAVAAGFLPEVGVRALEDLFQSLDSREKSRVIETCLPDSLCSGPRTRVPMVKA